MDLCSASGATQVLSAKKATTSPVQPKRALNKNASRKETPIYGVTQLARLTAHTDNSL